jgi:phosphinothricin acetyltransferase
MQTARRGSILDAMDDLTIDALQTGDWPGVRAIYEEGIATGLATFEHSAPSWDAWDRSHRRDCRLVGHDANGDLVGWAALSHYSPRAVYAGVAELSVYVAQRARSRGVGAALLGALIEASEAAGIWTLQAGVMADNSASLALHEALGFRRVGVRERIGRDAQGHWRDVVLLERRSETVGRSAP